MKVKFEIEIFSNNLAFIKIKGCRRGFVLKNPTNPIESLWNGTLEGKHAELKIEGSNIYDLNFAGIAYKYDNHHKNKPKNLKIYN